jgi:hypothetical protein
LYAYSTEDGKKPNGKHGRNKYHRSFTVLEREGQDQEKVNGTGTGTGTGMFAGETTGLVFSMDYQHLYVAFQSRGRSLVALVKTVLPSRVALLICIITSKP